MPRALGLVLVGFLSLLLSGCTESSAPLSSPGEPVDPRFLGNWVQTNPSDSSDPYRLVIRQFSPREVLVLFAQGDNAPSLARGFLTVVAETKILNL